MNQVTQEFEKKLAHFHERRLALLLDDCAANGSAVLCAPASKIDESLLNEALHISPGTCFVALSSERVKAFMLAPMTRPSVAPGAAHGGNPALSLCVSVEAREGVTTGISVPDRTRTISILGEAQPNPRKLVKPGHIFPVQVRDGGVLVRNALAEGAFDLVRLSCRSEAAFFMDLFNTDGDYAEPLEARAIADSNCLPTFSLNELIHYRLSTEVLVTRAAETRLPSRLSCDLRAYLYRSSIHGGEHLALVKGSVDPKRPLLTRIQAECTLADVFGGNNPPSRRQLHAALAEIDQRESGAVIYLRRTDRGVLREQIRSGAASQGQPSPAEIREYGLGAQILRDLGAEKIELLSSSNRVLEGLGSFGLEIVGRRAISGAQGGSCE